MPNDITEFFLTSLDKKLDEIGETSIQLGCNQDETFKMVQFNLKGLFSEFSSNKPKKMWVDNNTIGLENTSKDFLQRVDRTNIELLKLFLLINEAKGYCDILHSYHFRE